MKNICAICTTLTKSGGYTCCLCISDNFIWINFNINNLRHNCNLLRLYGCAFFLLSKCVISLVT